MAACDSRIVSAGPGSSGSFSVLTIPPSGAFRMVAKLWATNRVTSASRAAASSASVPSVRSRLVRAKVRSKFFEKRTSARAVA